MDMDRFTGCVVILLVEITPQDLEGNWETFSAMDRCTCTFSTYGYYCYDF
jgi:hypothetical protein